MKLLLCTKCQDIVRLFKKRRRCKCGRVAGLYTDDDNVIYMGDKAIPISIDNTSLLQAIIEQPNEGEGKDFQATIPPINCTTFQKYESLPTIAGKSSSS